MASCIHGSFLYFYHVALTLCVCRPAEAHRLTGPQDHLSEDITYRRVDIGSPPFDRTYHLSLAPQPTHMQYVTHRGLRQPPCTFTAENVMQKAPL